MDPQRRLNATAPVRCGIVGYPLAHTRSPELHRAFAVQAGIRIAYAVLPARAAEFGSVVHKFFERGGRGLNITLPHKERALALADTAGAAAIRAGAANVLTRLEDGRVRADNVDGEGFLRDLARLGFAVRGSRVCVLGAGGAAAGVVCALLEANVAEVLIRNRHAQRAQALAARLDDPRVRIAAAHPAAFDLLVNATSASLTNACPDFPESAAGPETLAYDLVYAAEPTPFMQRAADRGARVCDGWGMLVEQAAESFYLWHGTRPAVQSLCRSPNHDGKG